MARMSSGTSPHCPPAGVVVIAASKFDSRQGWSQVLGFSRGLDMSRAARIEDIDLVNDWLDARVECAGWGQGEAGGLG